MASHESVFDCSSPSLADLTNAIEKIEAVIEAKKLSKKSIYDMLLGFRVLQQALQQNQIGAHQLVIKWLSLFLKIQSITSIQNESVRGYFEKVMPSAVTYMIGCLQYKQKGINSYHFQLLEMIHELLSNVRLEVLEKLANFETGIITCVWLPIDFVGDFNTQMMVLRLLVMLLKCVDATRLESAIDKIRCTNRTVLKDKLTAVIAVANFPAALFEKTARELLNTYNMHLTQHIKVYSFCCKTFKFGDNIEFYKPMNADNFWIDVNHAPRTLSFNGRCLAYNQATYTDCSVSLQIAELTLNDVNLTVKFQAPAKLIKNANAFPDISSISTAKIILSKDEAKRLLENQSVLKYYNKNLRSQGSNVNASIVHLHNTSVINNSENNESIEDNRVTAINSNATPFDYSITSGSNTLENINMENEETASPNIRRTGSNESSCIDQPHSSKQFKKSYDFLIGHSKEVHTQVNEKNKKHENIEKTKPKNKEKEIFNFKQPRLPNLEKLLNSEKINKPQQTRCSKLVNYSTSSSDSNPSPKNTKELPTTRGGQKARKRFFKTKSSEDEYKPPIKKKQPPRKRNTRNIKSNTNNTTSKKPKKVIEVKPMLLSNNNLRQIEGKRSTNNPLNDITTNVQNVHNIITIDITESGTSNLASDIYDNLNVSDAEPGQSYRNFKTRCNTNEQQDNAPECKRSRKSIPRAVKKDISSTGRLENNSLSLRTTKPGMKRASPKPMDLFDEVRASPLLRSKVRKIEATKNNDENLNLHSSVEVDINASHDNIETIVAQGSISNNKDVRNIKNNTSNSITNNFQIPNTATKPRSQPQPNHMHIQEITVNKSHTIPTLSTESMQVNENQIDDIEECRRNVDHNESSIVNDSDEFSDFPTFPNIMELSGMLSSSQCESSKNRTNQTTTINPSNIELNSPVKTNPKTDLSNRNSTTTNMLESHTNLICYSRSENDSVNEESINLNNTLEQPTNKPTEHVFLTPQMPLPRFRKTRTSLTKCQVTTTETSIITQQDRFIHQQQFLLNLTASSNTPLNLSKSCTRAKTKTTTQTLVKETSEIDLSSFMRRSANIQTPTPQALRQESANMIANYTNNLNAQFDRINSGVSKNSSNSYIQKTCDIAESIIEEVERERVSLLDLEANVERLSRQLNWQYEAYQRKSQQFECFKQHIETLFGALNNNNILEEIQSDTRNKIQQLQETSDLIANQQWRDFINEITENFLKDISSVSNL